MLSKNEQEASIDSVHGGSCKKPLQAAHRLASTLALSVHKLEDFNMQATQESLCFYRLPHTKDSYTSAGGLILSLVCKHNCNGSKLADPVDSR